MKTIRFTKRIMIALLAVVMALAGAACTSDTGNSAGSSVAPPPAGSSAGGDAGSSSTPTPGGSSGDSGAAQDYSGVTVRIAQQYGMQYAAVYVMEKLDLLQKHLPGATLEWSQLAGGSAVNEALLANQLDVGFMGLPPALIAWDKGADFKIAAGVCVPPSELMVKSDTIKSIADLQPTDKIGVPSVGSIQHIMLAMAAERELGDANALDGNILGMANPDAYAALSSGTEVVGHFASMPYIDMETKDGCASILTAREAYGQGASIICVTTKTFHDEMSAGYEGLMAALTEAIDLINAKDPEAIKVVAEVEKISEEDALRYLEWPGTIYDTKAYGAMGLAQFMFEQGFITKAPARTDDIMWPGTEAVDQ